MNLKRVAKTRYFLWYFDLSCVQWKLSKLLSNNLFLLVMYLYTYISLLIWSYLCHSIWDSKILFEFHIKRTINTIETKGFHQLSMDIIFRKVSITWLRMEIWTISIKVKKNSMAIYYRRTNGGDLAEIRTGQRSADNFLFDGGREGQKGEGTCLYSSSSEL